MNEYMILAAGGRRIPLSELRKAVLKNAPVVSGAAGPQGPAGSAGSQGSQGPPGTPGETGPAGPQGSAGADGAPGPKGDRGDDGEPGPAGEQGPPGDKGETGAQGQQGIPGTPGNNGSPGSQGIQGIPGPANVVMARVAADIAQSSNVTFSNLFTRAVLPGEVWSFSAVIFFTSAAATTGIVAQVDTPASPTASQCAMFTQETATAGRFLPAAANATMIGTAALASSVVNTARVSGTVEVGPNGGNLVIKFRSEVNASAVTVKRGSWCAFYKH